MEIFAERLRILREEKSLSILELSKLIKVSKSTLYRWEKSQGRVKASHLIIIADFFNVSIDYLLGLED